MGTFNSNLSIDTIHKQLSQRINSIGESLYIIRLEEESAEFKITYTGGGLVLKVKLFKKDESVIVDYEHIALNALGMEVNPNLTKNLRKVQEQFAEILFRGVRGNISEESSSELEKFVLEYKDIGKGAESSTIRNVLIIVGFLLFLLLVSRIAAG